MVWVLVALFCIIPYLILISVFYFAWIRLKEFITDNSQPATFISIIIPARNEGKNISNILNDLALQTYPSHLFEVLVINDHSDDNTYEIAKKSSTLSSNVQVFNMPTHIQGKKLALQFAYKNSKGKLIITLDADCHVLNKWLQTIEVFFRQKNPKLIICPLLYYRENNVFQYMQSLESLSLVASGAGAAASGKPILCNGANLAFEKQVLTFYKNYIKNDVASGDDIFLLSAVKKYWPNSIYFLKSRDAAAYTKAESTLQEFLQQRKRWASKSKKYSDTDIILVSLVVFSFNMIIAAIFVWSIVHPIFFLLFFALLILKSIADWFLLNSFALFFNKKNMLKYFLQTQLIYPFYIVFMAIYGNVGKFEWKKRIYK